MLFGATIPVSRVILHEAAVDLVHNAEVEIIV